MFRTCALLLSVFAMAATANAQQDKSPAGQAHWMLERLTGVHWPKGNAVETQMAARISANDAMGAANLATNQKQFFNVTVKLMSLKLSTREETVRLRLNDLSAAFIGVTRDQTDARELLYGDFYYAYDPAKNLTNLNVGGRIYEMDANGKRQYLDGREIELKRERVQQAINQYCNGAKT